MPLETAGFLSELNSANPAHSDQVNQADAHIRLIKAALLATFPNFTAAALTSTQAQIDAAVASAVTNGIAKLADAGAFFNTNDDDGFTNPAAGEVDVKAGGNIVAKFKSDLSTTFMGAVSAPAASSGFVGPGAIPIGGSMPWYSDTLPDAAYGTYAWLNGQAISRTTFATLFAMFGTTYGAGDGTTTFNLPDTRDNVLVGKGTMGATSAAGRITNFVTSTLGNLFGECLHLLGIGEIPSHSHTVTDPGHTHNVEHQGNLFAIRNNQNTGSGFTASTNAVVPVNVQSATTGISIQNTGGGDSHNNVQPSLVCNWVMRIA